MLTKNQNNRVLNHIIEESNGNLYFVGFGSGDKQINFIASPRDLCLIDNEEKSKVPGFGAVCISYKSCDNKYIQTGKWLDFEREETHKYVFSNESVVIEKTFKSESNKLYLEIKVKNILDTIVEVDELSISVPVNNNFTEFRYDQEYLYKYRVHEHIYPGGSCGYQIIQRLNGEAPFLYVVPKDNTSFEHVAHYPGTTEIVREGIPNHSWPGSSVIFIHSKGYLERNHYEAIMGVDSCTTALIPPMSEVMYRMEIGFIESMEAFKQNQIDNDKIFVSAVPAMVSQINDVVHIYTYCASKCFIEESDEYSILGCKEIENGFVWKIKFSKLGQIPMTVKNEKGYAARLVFYIILPINELVDRRIKFINQNQILNCEGHKLDGAILPFSKKAFKGSFNSEFSAGLYVKEDSIWGNGSYEGGITEAMFIAQKNVLLPDKKQVLELEMYIRRYVRRYLQNPETNEVIWWCGSFSNDRAFDYMHVANLYYAMYLISKRFNLTEEFGAKEYLKFSYETLMKMYELSRQIDMTVGMMGAQNIFDILKAMQEEEMVLEYYELAEKVHKHRQILFGDNVPYGSECAYDNTGYEAIMSFAEHYNDITWIEKLSNVILSIKGMQPVWWWHGSDIRWWDAEPDFSESCLHYTSPLNSGALLTSAIKKSINMNLDTLSGIYGGIIGVFSKIHQDGSGSLSYCWEQESDCYGFHPFSGDIGLSLYGAMLCIGSFIYYTKKTGAVGFLCLVEEEKEDNCIIVHPTDNIGRKVFWYIEKWDDNEKSEIVTGKIEISTGTIRYVKLDLHLGTIEMEVSYGYDFAHSTDISVKCPADYSSALLVNGKKENFYRNNEEIITIKQNISEKTDIVKYQIKNIN